MMDGYEVQNEVGRKRIKVKGEDSCIEWKRKVHRKVA